MIKVVYISTAGIQDVFPLQYSIAYNIFPGNIQLYISQYSCKAFIHGWCSPAHLCNGTFHKHLQDLYIPLVVRYIDLMESSIAQSIHRGFEQETWQSVK